MINQRVRLKPVCLLFSLLLTACQSTTSPTVMPDIEEQLSTAPTTTQSVQPFEVPDAVMDDILTGQSSGGILAPSDPHFHVVAQDVAVRPFFASLFKGTPFSVIVHPDVSGTISLDLKDVTLVETLDVVRDIYGFDIAKRGSIWMVKAPGLRTETISVDYLMMTRNGSSSVQVNAGGVSQASQQGGGQGGNIGQQNSGGNFGGNQGGQQGGQGGQFGQQTSGSNIQTTSSTDFWKDLEKSLQTMLGIRAVGAADEGSDNPFAGGSQPSGGSDG